MMDSIDFTTLDFPQDIPGEIPFIEKAVPKKKSGILIIVGLVVISAIAFLVIYLSRSSRREDVEYEPEEVIE